MKYGYTKQIDQPFDKVAERAKSELAKEGFGILTEIDVKATLKKKLNVDYDNYLILGTCNPPFAYQALQAEKEIGLLLPCNVIIYEYKGQTFVSALLPTIAMQMIDNPALANIARQVGDKLKRVINNLNP